MGAHHLALAMIAALGFAGAVIGLGLEQGSVDTHDGAAVDVGRVATPLDPVRSIEREARDDRGS